MEYKNHEICRVDMTQAQNIDCEANYEIEIMIFQILTILT
jgi:hypothetical protein